MEADSLKHMQTNDAFRAENLLKGTMTYMKVACRLHICIHEGCIFTEPFLFLSGKTEIFLIYFIPDSRINIWIFTFKGLQL